MFNDRDAISRPPESGHGIDPSDGVPWPDEPRVVRNPRSNRLPTRGKHLTLSPNERDNYGVTITAYELGTGRMVTISALGPVTDRARELCERIDELEGDWRVLTISTPSTIYGDLQGERGEYLATPERRLLGSIARLDLLMPR